MAALFRGLGDAAADAEPLCLPVEGSRCAATSAHRQRDRQPSRLCRWRAEGQGVFYRQFADGGGYPDELRRRNGQGLQQARAVSKSRRVADADARAPGVPTLGRKGRRLPLREIGVLSMQGLEKKKRLLGLCLLPMLAACTQPSFLNSMVSKPPAERPVVDRSHQSMGNAAAHDFQPPPDPVIVDESVQPSSVLPDKVGECADTTITSTPGRFGADL